MARNLLNRSSRDSPRPASLYEAYGIEPAGIGTHLGIDEPRSDRRKAAQQERAATRRARGRASA